MSLGSRRLPVARDAVNAGSGEKSVIERMLDAGLYAPLGFLLTRDETIDGLAAAGREQIAFSRSLGRAALKGLARGTKPAAAGPPADELVEGYDDLTARDIVAVLAECSAAQARWIRDRESAGKARVTVLRAADRSLS